ncbi:uncharacterized protein LOC133195703 [Saccostrea echinata]|uniref:uncharacterized protein LOC133195703 n=1 Tax=Saccostrea echinata TaxID=191078 RepID=UPI002A806046|nr:uncharacterized protein LOC133195703 [Saccostrea echinata]
MSVGAVVQQRPPVTKSSRLNPCINICLAQRTKITKGFHLISPRKPSSDLPREPLQGTPLLSREGSQVYGHCTTPRHDSEEVNVTGKYVVNPYNDCEESQQTEQKPLTLFGERLDAVGNISSVRVTPLLQVRAKNDIRNLRLKDKQIQNLNTSSPECSSRGFMTPLTPPATPYTPGADQSFSVDGQHINCEVPSRSASSKDFNPGFIKRPRYCCGKCELRMLEHESLNIETECPFQAYQRQTKSSFCYNDDVMSRAFCSEQMIDPYVFYKSPWDKQTEHYAPFIRSKSVPTTTCFDPNSIQSPPRNRSPDSVYSSSSTSIDSLQLENEEETIYPSQKIPEQEQLEENNNITSSRTTTPYRNTEYHRNPLYVIPRIDGVNNQNEGVIIERSDIRENCSSLTEFVESGNYQKFHWADSWNVKETRIVSHCQTSIPSAPQPSVGGSVAVTGNGFQEIVTTFSSKEEDLHQQAMCSSDDLHNLLQGCVDSLRSISLRNTAKKASSAPENVLPSQTFFRDLRMPTDICYSPVTDKRYNRWKRTKKKGKNGRKSVMSNRSDDESTDEEKEAETKTPPGNRRRQKKAALNMAPKFEISSNDASSEPLSDAVHGSVQSQPEHSLMSSSNELRISLTRQSQKSFECSSSPEDQTVPIQLTSFPALSNYHASIHIGLKNTESYRSTPDIIASVRSTPCEDNNHVTPLSSTPDTDVTVHSRSEVEPPLITKEKSDNRPSSIISGSPLSSCDSFSTIRSNSRYSNSLAKDTIVRMSYSIGEKIKRSMAVVPVSYEKEDINVFKKKEPARKPTQKVGAYVVSNSPSKSQKSTFPSPLHPIPDPDVVRPHLSSLTLNHLLKTMPSKTSAGSSTSNKSLPEVTNRSLPDVKSSAVMSIVSSSNENQQEQKKKNFGIDRRFCLASKFPAVETRVPKIQPKPEPEVPSTQEPRQVITGISNLDFTPAFTFSLFELPKVYKDNNAMLKRRASMIK